LHLGIRRNALFEVGLYTENEGPIKGHPQDRELWDKLIKDYDLANIGQPLLKYRVLKASDSRGYIENQLHFRYGLTLNRIKDYLPGLEQSDTDRLANMLEFRPQVSKEDGTAVFLLFDRYFHRYIGTLAENKQVRRIGNRMKLYYLPQFIKTNKKESISVFFKCVLKDPVCLFDLKFYRKVIKVILQSVLSPQRYQLLTKEIFLNR